MDEPHALGDGRSRSLVDFSPPLPRQHSARPAFLPVSKVLVICGLTEPDCDVQLALVRGTARMPGTWHHLLNVITRMPAHLSTLPYGNPTIQIAPA